MEANVFVGPVDKSDDEVVELSRQQLLCSALPGQWQICNHAHLWPCADFEHFEHPRTCDFDYLRRSQLLGGFVRHFFLLRRNRRSVMQGGNQLSLSFRCTWIVVGTEVDDVTVIVRQGKRFDIQQCWPAAAPKLPVLEQHQHCGALIRLRIDSEVG